MANKTKITLNLFDVKSIDEALGQLETYSRRFDEKLDLFIKRIAEQGVEIAKEKVQKFNAVFSAELLNSIHLEKRSSPFSTVYLIVSDSKHTAFVEFGTGHWGELNKYPYDFPDGAKGWTYNDVENDEHLQYTDEPLQWGEYTVPANTYYWFYFKNGKWRLSQGMRSRPFMSETALELQKQRVIDRVAREVFRNA